MTTRVVGLLGKTCSTAAKESLITTLIGNKECHLERSKLGRLPSDTGVDFGIASFQQPSTRTVYMYVENGWMMNERFLEAALEENFLYAAGLAEVSMENWLETHQWLHDSEFELLRRLLVRPHVLMRNDD